MQNSSSTHGKYHQISSAICKTTPLCWKKCNRQCFFFTLHLPFKMVLGCTLVNRKIQYVQRINQIHFSGIFIMMWQLLKQRNELLLITGQTATKTFPWAYYDFHIVIKNKAEKEEGKKHKFLPEMVHFKRFALLYRYKD